ncbi:MAG: transglutaminase-like domain-containing protein [Bacteroidota bacterium]
MVTDKEIKALITLIDDPDVEIFKAVEEQILEKGISIIDKLEEAWENAPNEISQVRLENIIQKIQFSEIIKLLKDWKDKESDNLLKGIYVICKFHYPDLQFHELKNALDIIVKDVWLELNDNLTALEKVRIINHILFDVYQFGKNSSDFYTPDNSYLNKVIEHKKGNPISLCILYAIVAQELKIPIYGVNLPKNFILAYKDENDITKYIDELSDDVLFYINPFNKGGVFGKKEIDYYLKQLNIEPQKSFYQPCNNIEIIRRLILTLMHAYEKEENSYKTEDLKILFSILKD